jgi:carboxylate-amine ligase
LIATGCIPDGTKIWWDARPHSKYPTLEFRICDVCTRVEEAVCIAAILQALVFKLWKLRHDNMTFRVYPAELVEENKWRAVRYGLGGKLIDFGREIEKPATDLIREFIEWFLGDVLDELGTRKEVEYAFYILKNGSSADRQLATYKRTGDLRAVVDQVILETAEGVVPVPAIKKTDEHPIEFRPVSEVDIPIPSLSADGMANLATDVRD